jgi:hypothetical protein
MGRKSAFGSGIRDEQPESYFLELFWVKIHKFFDADPGSGMEKTSRIRNTAKKLLFCRTSDESFVELSRGAQSGGEKSVSTAVYMMALQASSSGPLFLSFGAPPLPASLFVICPGQCCRTKYTYIPRVPQCLSRGQIGIRITVFFGGS